IAKIEDTLILAVCGHPELFNTTFDEVGIPVEVCRKRWKGLRDSYLKEKRRSTDKKSGSGAGTYKKWKYSAVLSFLDPFITPRDTSGNMGRGVEEDGTAEYDSGPVQEDGSEAAAGPSQIDSEGQLTSEMTQISQWRTLRESLNDELFLKSLVPSLERLPPQQKEYVKFQIHKLIYEDHMLSIQCSTAERNIPTLFKLHCN
uniref:MADF domain-containing protein n=1 Tax=Cyclopterus lumpus TaxID=8103 RepID=A0A8C2ZMT2_CYCLU